MSYSRQGLLKTNISSTQIRQFSHAFLVWALLFSSICFSQENEFEIYDATSVSPAAKSQTPVEKPPVQKKAVKKLLVKKLPLNKKRPLKKKKKIKMSWGQFLGVSGSVRGAYWTDDKNYTDKTGFPVGSVWLNLRPKKIFGFKSYLDSYVQFESNEDKKKDPVLAVREVYIDRQFGNFDFRLGRQIVVWGRGDKVNPTDNLSVRSFNRLFTDDEDQRQGILAAKIAYNLGDYNIALVSLPEWISPIYPLPPIEGIAIKDVRPKSSSGQVGFKIDRSGGEIDWSISYFDGLSKVPNLLPIADNVIGLTYEKIQVAGADFATNVGEYGLRGELAYTQTVDRKNDDPFRQNSFIFGVLGADRNLTETFNFNVQILYRQVVGFKDQTFDLGPDEAPLIAFQNLFSQQQTAQQFGVTLRPSLKFLNDTLEVEATYLRLFFKGDGLLRPKITYAFSDKIRLIAGSDTFFGPDDSYFGFIKKASGSYLEFRYLF